MDENKFWTKVLTLVAVVIVAAIAAPAGCTAYESKRIADAIEKGTDPIDARCGIAGTANSGGMMCILRAANPIGTR